MTDTTEAGRPETGVVMELARDDLERKRFLTMAGKRMGAGTAAAGLAAFIAACGSSSKSSSQLRFVRDRLGGVLDTERVDSRNGDLAIVNYALTLEYLEAQFYDKVIASGLFRGTQPLGHQGVRLRGARTCGRAKKVATSLGTPRWSRRESSRSRTLLR